MTPLPGLLRKHGDADPGRPVLVLDVTAAGVAVAPEKGKLLFIGWADPDVYIEIPFVASRLAVPGVVPMAGPNGR